MKNSYLLPILAFVPLIIVLFMLSQLEYKITPALVGVIIVFYLALNIIYSVVKRTFHISILVELTLVSAVTYYVLTQLI